MVGVWKGRQRIPRLSSRVGSILHLDLTLTLLSVQAPARESAQYPGATASGQSQDGLRALSSLLSHLLTCCFQEGPQTGFLAHLVFDNI